MNSIFTHKDTTEGNVGIGKLPNNLYPILDDIYNEYHSMIPDKSNITYHTYYTNLCGKLKENFDKIQYNEFWNNICDNNDRKYCVVEMNEIYYSNPKPKFEKTNLYGAAANLIPHKDCILFNFRDFHFYRIIIGLTDNNNDTATSFVNLNIEHKINKGDYIIFDFDKTLHQVKKYGIQETPRLLLKLHFIVCDNGIYSNNYIRFVTNCYIFYYYIARYTEQNGTDPKTFMGFFFGLIWEWPFYSGFKPGALSLVAMNIHILHTMYNVQNIGHLALYSSCNMVVFYLFVVSFYYFRYVLFKIK